MMTHKRNCTPSSWFAEVESALRHNGQRMTQPRRAVMAVLDGSTRPLKADEIRRQAGLAESDLVTVYRNLDAIRTLGLLQRIVLEDGVQLFEAVRPDRHFHHIICRNCHRTLPIDVCFGHELEDLASESGFDQIEHVIEVFGRCKDCQ